MVSDELPELPSPDDITPSNAWSSLAEVHDAVAGTNLRLAAAAQSKSDLYDELTRSRDSGLPDRLKKWLEKLYKAVKAIVQSLADVVVVSYSITVGSSISVTVEFSGSAASGDA